MKIIVCLDDKNGMTFNKRRQSRDSVLIENVLKSYANESLWMNEYSYKLFNDSRITVDNEFLLKVNDGYAFVETDKIDDYLKNIDKFVVYRWNRIYPASTYFKIDLNDGNWVLEKSEEFEGSSHEKITKEIWLRNEKI